MKAFVFGLLPMVLLIAAAPVPDPVRDRIIADARSMAPAAIAFDRTTRLVRTGGGSTTNILRVERWDGKRWSLVSLNGKPPTKSQRQEAEKLAAASPVPGYYRLAALMAGATETTTDPQGRSVLKVPVLPAGSVRTDSSDISDHLRAEVTVASQNGQPWVQRVRVTSREPFKMNMLIRVLSFEQVSEYRLGSDGKPRLATQNVESRGTMFGFAGGEKGDVTYVYR